MKRKLIPKPDLPQADSVAFDKRNMDGNNCMQLVFRAAHAWDALERFRRERDRCKKYMLGDQWCDLIEHNGKLITEEEYIQINGNIPLKNNLIRRLIKTVVGTYRNQNTKPICVARDREEQRIGEVFSTLLDFNMDINEKTELDARMFEELLFSGMVIQKETFSTKNKEDDCWTDNINPNQFFMAGPMADSRMTDLEMVGQIHDLSHGALAAMFAHSDEQLERLNEIYTNARNREYMSHFIDAMGKNKKENVSFLQPADMSFCRVIEVWSKEQRKALRCHDWLSGDAYIDSYASLGVIKRENEDRLQQNIIRDEFGNPIINEDGSVKKLMPDKKVPLIDYEYIIEDYWYYRFLSPFGDVLEEGESPYEHGGSPYTVRIYPFVDGEAHSLVADIIDQQKFINHYIILQDFIAKSSAKGVLIVDESSIPDGMSLEDIADEWTRFNGVIKLKLKQGAQPPKQLVNTNRPAGLQDMIALQMQLMEDVSGVHGAMQGKDAKTGTSGFMYQQQATNASTSIADILEFYAAFRKAGLRNKIKNIQQFYDIEKIERIVGADDAMYYRTYGMDKADIDITIADDMNTPVYRAINNEFLMQLVNGKMISLEQALQVGEFKNGDKLLQLIRTERERNEQMSAMPEQIPQGLPQGIPQAQ